MSGWYIAILLLFIFGVIFLFALFSKILQQRRAALSRRALEDIYSTSQYRNRQVQKHIPHNDFIGRDKLREAQKRKELEAQGVTKYQPHATRIEQERNSEVEIVGVVEPKGFWTRFIISQKLGFIMARLNFQKRGGGRWVNFIEAQGASQGKNQDRGR